MRLGFFQLLLGGSQGKDWQDCNLEVMQWSGENDRRTMSSNAFPGANRPPPAAPVIVQTAPVMIRLIAPDGTTSFSHEGAERNVDKDGSITVPKNVADVLRTHGFRDAA